MKKVFLIDDDAASSWLLKTNLEATGYFEVRVENDSRRAVRSAQEFGPDVILSDVIMPHVDGGDVAAAFRADRCLRNVPIVFVTGAVARGELEMWGDMIGGYPYVAKPVQMPELVASVHRYADKGRAMHPAPPRALQESQVA
jgi:two-component system, OmpR family, response regulator